MLSASVLIGFQALNAWLNPPIPNEAVQEAAQDVDADKDEEAAEAVADADGNADAAAPQEAEISGEDGFNEADLNNQADVAEAAKVPRQRIALGSLDPESPYKMLVWFTNQGAAIESIALNEPRYRDLEDKSGYLGYFAFSSEDTTSRINVVGAGTPAAKAIPTTAGDPIGLQVGDIIKKIGDKEIGESKQIAMALSSTTPGETIQITVERGNTEHTYSAELVHRPLELIRPEPLYPSELNPAHPLSYRLTLAPKTDPGLKQLRGQKGHEGIEAMLVENWEMAPISDGKLPGVEFRYRVKANRFPELKLKGDLLVIKRFRLAKRDQQDEAMKETGRLYHLDFDFEIKNLGDSPAEVGYQLDGPTGLPLEGWWYTYKTHPTKFGGAGVRDVAVKTFGDGHQLFTNPKILEPYEEYQERKKTGGLSIDNEDEKSYLEISDKDDAGQLIPMDVQYAGVDAQYFASALIAEAPDAEDQSAEAQAERKRYLFESILALPVADEVDELRANRTDVSFRLISGEKEIAPGKSFKQDFLIFAGPKQRDILALYDLQNFITYGWFPLVAKPLMAVLHFFYSITGNYGIAIILLTVLVRGCMFPIGRQQALNAQKMQSLAPEMKIIAEKYKDDMEKKAAAQRELFRKNNYNPLAGCLPVFFQLPIFIGLYRALSVDIELRQAPLIPGLSWCSNLAGPDQLWFWEPYLPSILAAPNGWLGPYLNILPLISVFFMIMHQKMFTPPPTDEQQAMQQKMMKYMMFFFAFMFFRVPAGLCIYFITSSAWALAERKLLPKPKPKQPGEPLPPNKPSLLSKLTQGKQENGNGTESVAERRRQRQKRR
ncbi:MAG: membrane protein insertase YidC [Planctomycetaceae bacterium]|nr:membrane protein insertase YidC [Planctomycetaceae bacterium]